MSNKSDFSSSRRQFLLSAGVAGGALVVGSTLTSPRAWAADGVPAIDVGQIAPMTGSAAEFGPFYRDAAQLAFNQVNEAAKKVFGGPLIKHHYTVDTTTVPTTGVQAAQQMVDTKHVPAIIGGWSSGVTVAVATSVSIPSGVLQVGNGCTSPLITVLPADQKADLMFRTSASDALQGVVAAQLVNGEIVPDYKYKKVSIIFIDNPYGQGLADSFTRSFVHRGGKVLAAVSHPEEVQPTYKAQLSKALKDKPDLLMCYSYPAHTSTFLKESRDIFNFTKWQFCDGNAAEDIIKDVGDVVLGQYGTAPGEDTSTEGYKDFARNFKTDFSYDHIPPFTTTTYDAAMTIALAMAKVVANGQTDASKITGSVLRDQLREVADPPGEKIQGGATDRIVELLKAIKAGDKVNYEGVSGPVDFDKNGDVTTPVNVWKFKGNGLDTVKMQPAADIPAI